MPPINDGKEASLHLQGNWLVEIAEMSAMRKSEIESVKAFISRQTEKVRAPYGRLNETVHRQCVFVLTTNEIEFLRDMTGGRRFWPIECGDELDKAGLKRDRDQLFAEALAAFNAGEQWFLPPEVEAIASEVQESHREKDPWESEIEFILQGSDIDQKPVTEATMGDLLRWLGVPVEKQNLILSKRVGAILRRQGWKVKHTMRGNVWVRQ